MSDWPNDVAAIAPYASLSTADDNCPVADVLIAAGQTLNAAAVWPSAGMAIYVPVLVRVTATIYQMGWGNGATLGSSVDVGIYDGSTKARLVSTGSTAQAGASVLQAVDVADTLVPPGLHYLAMAMDTITPGLVDRASLNSVLSRVSGAAQQASAFPLPSTATFAALTTMTLVPLIIAAIEGGVF
jgi:hypothetical protein